MNINQKLELREYFTCPLLILFLQHAKATRNISNPPCQKVCQSIMLHLLVLVHTPGWSASRIESKVSCPRNYELSKVKDPSQPQLEPRFFDLDSRAPTIRSYASKISEYYVYTVHNENGIHACIMINTTCNKGSSSVNFFYLQ